MQPILLLCFVVLLMTMNGCSKEYQGVNLNIEDFRFVPDQIYLASGQSSRLTIRNLGRELHRFKSQVVARSDVRETGKEKKSIIDAVDGVIITPGKTLELVFTLQPGIYDFQCPIRGHRCMKGMFLVEFADRE